MKASTPFLTQDWFCTSGSRGSARGVQGQESDGSSAPPSDAAGSSSIHWEMAAMSGFRQWTAGERHSGLPFPLEVLYQGAGAALPGQHRGSRESPSLEKIGHALQTQSALAGFAVVTGKAVPAQDRPNLAFEPFLRLRRNGSRLAGGGERRNQ